MDKILRNTIIFGSAILLIAAIFVVLFATSQNASSNSINGNINSLSNGNTVNDADNSNTNVNSEIIGDYQDVKLSVKGGTYILTPSKLKEGVPVKMTADLSTVRGCARDVVISAFGVRKYVKEGDNVIIFTPTKTGTINIACSMNMYRGTFSVE